MNCFSCQEPLAISTIERRNHSQTGTCKTCSLNHMIKRDEQGQYYLVNVQKRFAANGTSWHATYRLATDTTTFVSVQRQAPPIYKDGVRVPVAKVRAEHVISGYVTPERFLNLLSFL